MTHRLSDELEWDVWIQTFLSGVFVGLVESGRIPPGCTLAEAEYWSDTVYQLEAAGTLPSDHEAAKLKEFLHRVLPRVWEKLTAMQAEALRPESDEQTE